MGNAFSENQSANIIPPRTNGGSAFTLENTSRRKDFGGVDIFGKSVTKGGSLFLTFVADVKWWFRMSSTDTGTVSETAIDAATDPITLQANWGVEVQPGQPIDVRVDRVVDRYMIVKGSGAGTMRWWASSEITGDSA